MHNKPWHVPTAAAFTALVLTTATVVAPRVQAAEHYEAVHGWPELPPGEILGQATGVDVDSKGNVWVFHRAGREWSEPAPVEPINGTTVWVFEGRTGRVLSSWGANTFVMPHGLTIDRDDNVWLTDVGLHQVFKFAPDGRQLLVLGEARVAGNDARHFDKPTDVAIARDGTFYVSDGYGNTRVLKFAADGTLLLTWGSRGTGPGEFDLPHGIAIDERGRVLVADRSNARVQVFDDSGKFLAQWQGEQIGRPYAVAPVQGGRAFIADGGDQPEQPPDRSGVAIVDADGQPILRFGRFGNQDGQFRLAHDLALAKDGSVYVVDAWGQRLQKFVPSPARGPAGHQAGEEAAVLAAMDRYMTAISANDLDTMASMQTPDGMSYRAGPVEGGGSEVIGRPNAYWVDPARKDGTPREERYWAPTVQIRGAIAVVWAPYEFWIDGKTSHCGVDVFNFVKIDGAWRVANAMWTVEPEACDELRSWR